MTAARTLWPAAVQAVREPPTVSVLAAPGAAADSARAQSVAAHQVIETTRPREAAADVTGSHVMLLGPDDRLDPAAVQLLSAALDDRRRPVLVWADSDTVDADGVQLATAYRTAWDPDRLAHAPCIAGPVVLESTLPDEVGGWATAGTSTDQVWDLLRRLAPRLDRRNTEHVPAVLAHDVGPLRAERPGVDLDPGLRPAVSVLVPTAGARLPDGVRHVDALLATLLNTDLGVDLDVVVAVDGTLRWRPPADRRVRVVTVPGPFSFSRTIDVLALHARTDLLLLLNDDVTPTDDTWLLRLVAQARVPGVGAVGARLDYPDGALQHVGLAQIGGLPFHLHHHVAPELAYDAMATLPHAASSVTGACLLTPRAVFESVGGLSQDLPMNFNDVDYGLTVIGLGLRVVVEPRARLVHHESASREAVVRTEEVVAFSARWPRHGSDPWLSRARAFQVGLGEAWLAAEADGR